MSVNKNCFLTVLGLFALSCGFAMQSHALKYGAILENSEWQVEGSELECGLSQPIPAFGEGVFTKKAGEPLAFYLKPFNNPMRPGEGALIMEGPAWRPDIAPRVITMVEVTDAPIPLEVEDPYAEIMLSHLNQGLIPTFEAGDLFSLDLDEPVRIGLSSVNFQQAYLQYISCLSQLLPVNFQQIARSAIFFQTNKSSLNEDVRNQLDLIARYVKADKSVKRVFIDGHTDDTGNKRINKNLSKRRSELVASYFKKAGVSSKLIVARYHADKYPALKNDSDLNRARNRRVTIRLERE